MLVDAILVFGETLIDTFHHFLTSYRRNNSPINQKNLKNVLHNCEI